MKNTKSKTTKTKNKEKKVISVTIYLTPMTVISLIARGFNYVFFNESKIYIFKRDLSLVADITDVFPLLRKQIKPEFYRENKNKILMIQNNRGTISIQPTKDIDLLNAINIFTEIENYELYDYESLYSYVQNEFVKNYVYDEEKCYNQIIINKHKENIKNITEIVKEDFYLRISECNKIGDIFYKGILMYSYLILKDLKDINNAI